MIILNTVIHQKGSAWAATCTTFNVEVLGEDPESAMNMFRIVVQQELLLGKMLKREFFHGIEEAPRNWREYWKEIIRQNEVESHEINGRVLCHFITLGQSKEKSAS